MTEKKREKLSIRIIKVVIGTFAFTGSTYGFSGWPPDLSDRIIFWLVIFCFGLSYLIYQDLDELENAAARLRELDEKIQRLTENRNALKEQYQDMSRLLYAIQDRSISLLSIATKIADTNDKASRQNLWKFFMEEWNKWTEKNSR